MHDFVNGLRDRIASLPNKNCWTSILVKLLKFGDAMKTGFQTGLKYSNHSVSIYMVSHVCTVCDIFLLGQA
jgi:hypothetical protein